MCVKIALALNEVSTHRGKEEKRRATEKDRGGIFYANIGYISRRWCRGVDMRVRCNEGIFLLFLFCGGRERGFVRFVAENCRIFRALYIRTPLCIGYVYLTLKFLFFGCIGYVLFLKFDGTAGCCWSVKGHFSFGLILIILGNWLVVIYIR